MVQGERRGGKPGGISNYPEPPPTFCGANLKKITGNFNKSTGSFNKSTGSFNKSTESFNVMRIPLKKAYEKGSLDGLPVSTK